MLQRMWRKKGNDGGSRKGAALTMRLIPALLAAVAAGGNVSLTPSQLQAMASYLDKMKRDTALVKEQRRAAEKDVLALAAFTLPEADTVMLGEMLGKLSSREIEMLRKARGARGEALTVCTPAFCQEDGKDAPDNSPFKI